MMRPDGEDETVTEDVLEGEGAGETATAAEPESDGVALATAEHPEPAASNLFGDLTGTATVHEGANQPDDPKPGDRWKDTHTGKTFEWCLFGDDIWGWSPVN
jgi:hypothetical protein